MIYYILDVDPSLDYAPAKTVELDGVAIRLLFRWMPMLGRWCMSVRDPADNILSAPIMVAPGGEIFVDKRDPRLPPGRWGFGGPDPYNRTDLGKTVQLYYVPVAK